jgi:hypothetical protein
MAAPTPQEQIEFLQKVQRLLTEGLFVASYKFALLRAIADLAVLKGDDSGDELEIAVTEIAEIFVELYWRQTRPFCGPGQPQGQILKQNTGQQAAVVRHIANVQAGVRGSLPLLKTQPSDWKGLVAEVADVVSVMPLWKLQRIGDEVVDFLYPNLGKGRTIRLKPGVTYCLRNFYGIMRNLIEGAWINFVRSQNLDIMGHSTDIGAFLFGVERSSLEAYRPLLIDIQKDNCFYCHVPLRQTGEVDHFVPWSRYPVDLGHNFVMAHRGCNGKKRDYLADESHLAAWRERNDLHAPHMNEYFQQAHLPNRLESSVSIARWAYSQTAQTSGLVWVEAEVLRHLGSEWSHLLRAMSHA